jgi:hypothetical protein
MTDNAGPLLCRAGLISQAQLKTAYETQGRGGGTLAEVLIGAELIDEERLCDFFRDRLMVPRVGVAELSRVNRRVTGVLPSDMAGEFRVVPMEIERDGTLVLAMADPSDTHAIDEIHFFTGKPVVRVVAPVTAIAWALHHFYGVTTPLTGRGAQNRKPQAQVVSLSDDGFEEDTPLPTPVPFDETTGRIPLLRPSSAAAQGTIERTSSPEAEAALLDATEKLLHANDRDTVAQILVGYLRRLCRRAAFFVVRRGELQGFFGGGLGIKLLPLRDATLSLEGPSTFRDIVATRLPYRGPVADAPSRDFLIDGLGWAPTDMLAVPVSVRERVVGILYGDDRLHSLPDAHLAHVARCADGALERAVVTKKAPSASVPKQSREP